MAILPPKPVLEIIEKLGNDEELTEDESELLSIYSKSFKSSNGGGGGIFSFLSGFACGSFIRNYSEDEK